MEKVKTGQTIAQVDFRRTLRVIINLKTGDERKMTFADFEEQVRDIPIPSGAPEEVQELLVTAKNLLLYSWFYYPFSVTASLQASIAVEAALRSRLGAKPRDMLRSMLKQAIGKGLITDAGFPRWSSYIEAFQELYSLPKNKGRLTDTLLLTLPHFRNTMAHGNRFLDDIGLKHLDIASEVIGQLFPESAD